ncbi:MAG: protein phosphatase 2C domain-containing protein [Blastocatellia bacterium]
MDDNFQFSTAAITDRGLSEKRPQNEDSYLLLDEHGFFAVADGVGGAQAGDVASQMAVEILGEAFINYSATVDPEEILEVAIERANSAIFQMSNELPQLSSMATTVVALHVSGNVATIAHVGDSRLYRLDSEGRLFRETQDHSVVEEEVRAGRMTPEQALTHPSRNVISRALGAEPQVEIDLRTIMVDPGTTFLLCSDGITRHIGDAELGELLSTGMNPENLCEQMKELCFSRGAEDNLTAIVVKIAEEVARQVRAVPNTPEYAGDHEVETIASIRPPVPEPSVTEPAEVLQTLAVEPSPLAELDDSVDEQFLLGDDPDLFDAPENIVQTPEYTSSSVVVPAQHSPERDFSIFGNRPQVEPIREEITGTNVNKTLTMAGLFLAGILLGGIGSYLWFGSMAAEEPIPAPTPITEMTSPNISLTAFEDARRLVDSNPAKYIDAEAASLQTPEDYFLMGRAFLLTGKYFEAKRSYGEARNKLAQAHPKNAKIMESEIAMALVIIGNAQATEAFAKEISSANQSSAPANTSANANSPVR